MKKLPIDEITICINGISLSKKGPAFKHDNTENIDVPYLAFDMTPQGGFRVDPQNLDLQNIIFFGPWGEEDALFFDKQPVGLSIIKNGIEYFPPKNYQWPNFYWNGSDLPQTTIFVSTTGETLPLSIYRCSSADKTLGGFVKMYMKGILMAPEVPTQPFAAFTFALDEDGQQDVKWLQSVKTRLANLKNEPTFGQEVLEYFEGLEADGVAFKASIKDTVNRIALASPVLAYTDQPAQMDGRVISASISNNSAAVILYGIEGKLTDVVLVQQMSGNAPSIMSFTGRSCIMRASRLLKTVQAELGEMLITCGGCKNESKKSPGTCGTCENV